MTQIKKSNQVNPMTYLVVKVKDQDLFFNADEAMGEYVCSTPMLMDQETADSVMKYCQEVYHIGENITFSNSDLEIRKVQLNLI